MENVNILENYNNNFDFSSTKSIISTYSEIIMEYIKLCVNNLIIRENDYYIFTFKRGYSTLSHCFKVLFMYSKNLNIVEQNCNKANCYYIEFIGQIGEDSNSYLQLNSKDASLFVYKKILFDIDQDFRKNFVLNEEEKNFLKIIHDIIKLYDDIIMNIMDIEVYENKKELLNLILTNSKTFLNRILKLSRNNVKLVNIFVNNIYKQCDTVETFINISLSFIKKINKGKITEEKINEKILLKNQEVINMGNYNKIINYIYN